MSDLESRDPRRWGPYLWLVLEEIALAYPEQDPSLELQRTTETFLETLKMMLPCQECRVHYKTYVDAHPITASLGGRQDLVEWMKELKAQMPSKKPEVPVPNTQGPSIHIALNPPQKRINPRTIPVSASVSTRQTKTPTPAVSNRRNLQSHPSRYVVTSQTLQQRGGNPGCRNCGGGTKK